MPARIVSLFDSTARRALHATALAASLVLAGCGGSGSGGDAPPSPAGYPIAGTIAGLSAAGLVLRNNGGDDLTVPAHATSFHFATRVAAGGAYAVTIATQPDGMTCTVSNGSGSNVRAAVGSVAIACSAITHTVAGTIDGLTTGGLVLRNNGGDDLAIAADAATFQFATPVAQGGGYSVTVAAQPVGLTCTVGNGTGSNVRADVGNVRIACATSVFSIGGTVSGLSGSGLILQNNAGDDLAVPASATSFEFATRVAYNGNYAVTIAAQPAGQTCSVTHGSGIATTQPGDIAVACANIPAYTVTPSAGANGSISPSTPQSVNGGGNINFVATPDSGYAVDQWRLDGNVVQSGGSVYALTNVAASHTVAVSFAQVALVSSVANLALAVNGGTPVLTGTPRQITITNTGSLAATNVAINYPTWPTGTSANSTCGSTLAAASSCTITVTPGAVPTSNCGNGTAPTPGAVTVTHDAGSTQVDVIVLGYGCVYQQGLLYAVDDTTPVTGSIGGSVLTTTDISISVTWDAGLGAPIGAGSKFDGATNTMLIAGTAGTAGSAASMCSDLEIDSAGNTPCQGGNTCYSDWYLPAICEWSYDLGAGCPAQVDPAEQSIQSKLVEAFVLGSPAGPYWSSTEDSAADAWFQAAANNGSALQLTAGKILQLFARCARAAN